MPVSRTPGCSSHTALGTIALAGCLSAACLAGAPLLAHEVEPPVPSPGETGPDWLTRGAERLPLLAPCEPRGVDGGALCGTIEVAEDRSRPDGRRIGLHVVVLPAHAEDPPSDPVTYFAGGPGSAATARAVALSRVPGIRGRDLLFIDQRGAGRSHTLDCDLGGATETTATAGETVATELPEMFPADGVTACAERLSEIADLHLYTSPEHADDVEEVRRRLGYGPLNIQGGSYGTHAAMVFAQRHPESTRTLFLTGVDSPLRSNLAERSVWTERTLAGLGGVCADDEACRRLAPDLFGMVTELFGRLEAPDGGPRRVEVAEPQDPSKALTVRVERDWLAEQVRLILYYGFTSRALPWAVHRAHTEDDWAPLVRLSLFIDRFFLSTLADGVQLAVQCSEQMDFDVDRALARGEATLFGGYRLAQQVQGCAHWPHRKTDHYLGVPRPRPLPIPTVLVSGRWDPVTPPAYGEDATAYFPESRHLILDEGQHGPYDLEGGWACVNGIWADLLELGGLDGLDTACSETLSRPPWLTDGEAFTGYLEGTLAPLIE